MNMSIKLNFLLHAWQNNKLKWNYKFHDIFCRMIILVCNSKFIGIWVRMIMPIKLKNSLTFFSERFRPHRLEEELEPFHRISSSKLQLYLDGSFSSLPPPFVLLAQVEQDLKSLGRIHNASFSLYLTNGPKKLDCISQTSLSRLV